MTFGLDTSVVLRLLTGEPQELAARTLARYQEGIANGDSFYVSDIVASETYYAIQHHYGKTKEDALSALMAFSSGEGIAFSQNFAASINTPNIHRILASSIGCLLLAIGNRARSRFRVKSRSGDSRIRR